MPSATPLGVQKVSKVPNGQPSTLLASRSMEPVCSLGMTWE